MSADLGCQGFRGTAWGPRVYPKTPSPASERLEKPGISNVLGWVLGRRTEFIPFAPRRSHFWLDRDRMQERAKRNEFRSTTKIVARSWSLSENVLSGLGTLGKTRDRQRSRIVSKPFPSIIPLRLERFQRLHPLGLHARAPIARGLALDAQLSHLGQRAVGESPCLASAWSHASHWPWCG